MWAVRNRTVLLLLAGVALFAFGPSLSLFVFFSPSSPSSPALSALSSLHRLSRRATHLHDGLSGLVLEAQAMVEAAAREKRGTEVDEHCDGWVATLRYCAQSTSATDGTDCFCSSTALERMALCQSSLDNELQSAFSDFSALCHPAPPPASDFPLSPAGAAYSPSFEPSARRRRRGHGRDSGLRKRRTGQV